MTRWFVGIFLTLLILIFTQMNTNSSKVDSDFRNLSAKIDSSVININSKIDSKFEKTNERIDKILEARGIEMRTKPHIIRPGRNEQTDTGTVNEILNQATR